MNTRILLVSLQVFVPFTLHGQEAVPADLIENLGSDEFVARESAQAKLLGWSLEHTETAIPELLKLYRDDDDPEVRKRAMAILKALGDADYLSDGQGYLGILMQEEPLEAGQEGKMSFGIRILDVMRGSPADQAGLKMGDLIIALDGKGWEEMGAVTVFGETVAAKKPLVEVILMIKKGQGEPDPVTVKLGKRPTPDLRVAGDLGQLEQQAKERHFKEWLKKQQEK